MAFRQHTQLPLDGCLYALLGGIPRLTRSTLHCLFQRLGISCWPLSANAQSQTQKKFEQCSTGYLHVDFAEVLTKPAYP